MEKTITEYVAYEEKGNDAFGGEWTQTVIVDQDTGRVVAHFWGWGEPSLIHDWDPRQNGYCGKTWKKARRKGWRKSRYQEQLLAWALDALEGEW